MGRRLRLGFPGAQRPGQKVLWGLGDHACQPGLCPGIGVAADTSAETWAVCRSPPACPCPGRRCGWRGTPGLCSSLRLAPSLSSTRCPAERGCCPLAVRARDLDPVAQGSKALSSGHLAGACCRCFCPATPQHPGRRVQLPLVYRRSPGHTPRLLTEWGRTRALHCMLPILRSDPGPSLCCPHEQ